MTDFVTFNVTSSGAPVAGYTVDQVSSALAKVLKLPVEKAQKIVSSKRVLKKGLTQAQAETYQSKLQSIGLGVDIVRVEPPKESSGLELALEPMDDPAPESEDSEASPPPPPQAPASEASQNGKFACPKCDTEQEKGEQCVSCGVFFHKLEAAQSSDNGVDSGQHAAVGSGAAGVTSQLSETVNEINDDDDDSNMDVAAFQLIPLAAAAGAALVGALVWYFIAAQFDAEVGIIAWGIGGAVGFSAAALGGRGLITGVGCGALAFCAILGGKYMVFNALEDLFVAEIAGLADSEEVWTRDEYEMAMEEATAFNTNVRNGSTLRSFMVEHGYSDATQASDVSREEIEFFNENFRAQLEQSGRTQPSFEEWQEQTTRALASMFMEEVTFADMFGFLDILFFLLGVSTAFGLGSRGREFA